MRCFLPNSAILVCSQVCWGLPLFRFPSGFHSSALLTTCPSGPLGVWQIHPQNRCLISCSIGRCPVCLRSSLLLPQLLTDEHLQLLLQTLSQPRSFTAFTFDPKTLGLVLVVRCCGSPYWSQHRKCLSSASLSNSCLNVLVSASLLAYNAPKECEPIHFLNLRPYNRHTVITFGTNTHQL